MTTVAGRAIVAAHGLRIELPDRWEARLYLRESPRDPLAHSAAVRGAAHPAAYGHAGESMNPVLHLANFALPPGRGDFGTGAVELMGAAHAFVSVLEYDPVEAGRPLFAHRGVPLPALRDFAPNALQRRLPGQLGVQRFFTVDDRAFCLYAVLGSRTHAPALVTEVRTAVGNLQVVQR